MLTKIILVLFFPPSFARFAASRQKFQPTQWEVQLGLGHIAAYSFHLEKRANEINRSEVLCNQMVSKKVSSQNCRVRSTEGVTRAAWEIDIVDLASIVLPTASNKSAEGKITDPSLLAYSLPLLMTLFSLRNAWSVSFELSNIIIF